MKQNRTRSKKTKPYYPFSNDYTFGCVMQIPEFLTEFLEIMGPEKSVHLLDDPIPQKSVNLSKKSHGVRFDIHVQSEGYYYDIEMQKAADRYLPRRMSYYGSMLQVSCTKKGIPYKDGPDVCVIFLCLGDPLRSGKAVQRFEGMSDQYNQRFTSGITCIVYNAVNWKKAKDERQKAILLYSLTEKSTSSFTDKIDRYVKELNMNEKWRKTVSRYEERDAECREEGRSEGRKEGRKEGRMEQLRKTILILLQKGLLVSDIADLINEPLEVVQKASLQV